MEATANTTLTLAFLNVHGQSGLTETKQKQIEDYICRNKVDILLCQEININEESFKQCRYISSNYTILQKNAVNKFGTATKVSNIFTPENVKMITSGQAFRIENFTVGNVYLHSGTDGISRAAREQFSAETLPQLMINVKENGI